MTKSQTSTLKRSISAPLGPGKPGGRGKQQVQRGGGWGRTRSRGWGQRLSKAVGGGRKGQGNQGHTDKPQHSREVASTIRPGGSTLQRSGSPRGSGEQVQRAGTRPRRHSLELGRTRAPGPCALPGQRTARSHGGKGWVGSEKNSRETQPMCVDTKAHDCAVTWAARGRGGCQDGAGAGGRVSTPFPGRALSRFQTRSPLLPSAPPGAPRGAPA